LLQKRPIKWIIIKNFHLHTSKFDIPFNLFYYVEGLVVLQRELNHMHKLVGVYDQIEYSLPSFLKLYKIVEGQGMGEQEIIRYLTILRLVYEALT
jgi:hypothetical protein